jgi:hypothetical protein
MRILDDMNTAEIERIRKINATKAHGHMGSAVSHCDFLLKYIAVLEPMALRYLSACSTRGLTADEKNHLEESNATGIPSLMKQYFPPVSKTPANPRAPKRANKGRRSSAGRASTS